MYKQILITMMVILGFAACDHKVSGDAIKQGEVTEHLRTLDDSISYVIGTQIGESFQRDSLYINMDVFTRALKDALAGYESIMNQDEMQAVMTKFQDINMKRMQARMESDKKRLDSMGNVFQELSPKKLAEFKEKDGVVETESGLLYRFIEKGSGKLPVSADIVNADFRAYLPNGEKFDDTFEAGKPQRLPIDQLPPGWKEMLLLTPEGSNVEFMIPSALAYQNLGLPPGIPPYSALRFEMILHEIIAPKSLKVDPSGNIVPGEDPNSPIPGR